MIAAKSFSDHASKSGGSGGVPGVATSHSLTVQRPKGRKDTIHIQYEQEAILVTDQAANEGGCLPKSQLGRGLQFVGRELEDVGDPIDQEAGDQDVAARGRFHDEDAGCPRQFGVLGNPNGIRKS